MPSLPALAKLQLSVLFCLFCAHKHSSPTVFKEQGQRLFPLWMYFVCGVYDEDQWTNRQKREQRKNLRSGGF